MPKGDNHQQSEENPFINQTTNNANNRPVNNRQRDKTSLCAPINNNKKKLAVLCVVVICVVFLIVFSVTKLFFNRPNDQTYTLQVYPVARDSGQLIWVKFGDKEDAKYWTNSIEQFLSPYKRLAETVDHNGTDHCNYTSISSYYHCFLENTNCTAEDSYGYFSGSPCVVIKINKDFDELKLLSMHDTVDNASYHHSSNNSFNVVCGGETVADEENLGTVTYFPGQHLPLQYMSSVHNQSDYMPPFFIVKFNRPTFGILMYVKCVLLLPDLHVSNDTVVFQVLVDAV